MNEARDPAEAVDAIVARAAAAQADPHADHTAALERAHAELQALLAQEEA